MVREGKTIEINKEHFRIIANRAGSCDGCYFDSLKDKEFPESNCPVLAVTICCSNGGNILKKVKE